MEMSEYLWLASIIAALVIPSLIILVYNLHKSKKASLFSLIPLTFAICMVCGFGVEIARINRIENINNKNLTKLEYFIDDYEYILKEWQSLTGNSQNFKNYELDLSQLHYKGFVSDVNSYIYKNYNGLLNFTYCSVNDNLKSEKNKVSLDTYRVNSNFKLYTLETKDYYFDTIESATYSTSVQICNMPAFTIKKYDINKNSQWICRVYGLEYFGYNDLVYENGEQFVYMAEYSEDDNVNFINSQLSQLQSFKIALHNDEICNWNCYNELDEDLRVGYIVYLCASAVAVLINLVGFILIVSGKFYIPQKSYSSLKLETVKNEILSTQPVSSGLNVEPVKIEKPAKPKWGTLSGEEKNKYIKASIKELYQQQLNDDNLELTRQEKALKQYSIDNNDFVLEDLTDEERKGILKTAQNKYKNEEDVEQTVLETKKEIKSNSIIASDGVKIEKSNKKLLRTNPLWIFKSLYFAINSPLVHARLGKCLSISGEPPCKLDISMNGVGMKFVCYNILQGFTFGKKDVVKYKQKQSTTLQQRFEVTLKNGKTILIEMTPKGAEKINTALGIDLLED